MGIVCKRCGNCISDTDKFCNKCGTSYIYETCVKCGNPVALSDKFCTKCGTRVGSEYSEQKPKNKEMSKIKLVTVIALAIVAFSFVIGGKSSVNFNKQYAKYKDEVWCDISENGKEMRIDTNTNDVYGYHNQTAVSGVKDALDKTGFGNDVATMVINTNTTEQGLVNEHYAISWSNTDEKGIEITFIKE